MEKSIKLYTKKQYQEIQNKKNNEIKEDQKEFWDRIKKEEKTTHVITQISFIYRENEPPKYKIDQHTLEV